MSRPGTSRRASATTWSPPSRPVDGRRAGDRPRPLPGARLRGRARPLRAVHRRRPRGPRLSTTGRSGTCTPRSASPASRRPGTRAACRAGTSARRARRARWTSSSAPTGPTVEFRPLAPVRWQELVLDDLARSTTRAALRRALRARVRPALARQHGVLPGQDWVLRVRLVGRTPFYAELRGAEAADDLALALRERLRILASRCATTACHAAGRRGGARGPAARAERRPRPDPACRAGRERAGRDRAERPRRAPPTIPPPAPPTCAPCSTASTSRSWPRCSRSRADEGRRLAHRRLRWARRLAGGGPRRARPDRDLRAERVRQVDAPRVHRDGLLRVRTGAARAAPVRARRGPVRRRPAARRRHRRPALRSSASCARRRAAASTAPPPTTSSRTARCPRWPASPARVYLDLHSLGLDELLRVDAPDVAVGRGPSARRIGARVPALGRRRAARSRRPGRRPLAARPPRPARSAAPARPHRPPARRRARGRRRPAGASTRSTRELARRARRARTSCAAPAARWRRACGATPTWHRRWPPGATSSGCGPRRPPSSSATTTSRATPPMRSTGAGRRPPTPSARPPPRAAMPTSCRRSPMCRLPPGSWPPGPPSCASWRPRRPARPTCGPPSAQPRPQPERASTMPAAGPRPCSAARSRRATVRRSTPSARPTSARPSRPPRCRRDARRSPSPRAAALACAVLAVAGAGGRTVPALAAIALVGVAALLARSAAPRRGPAIADAVGTLAVAPSRVARPDAALAGDIDQLRAAVAEADAATAEVQRLRTLVATRTTRLAAALEPLGLSSAGHALAAVDDALIRVAEGRKAAMQLAEATADADRLGRRRRGRRRSPRRAAGQAPGRRAGRRPRGGCLGGTHGPPPAVGRRRAPAQRERRIRRPRGDCGRSRGARAPGHTAGPRRRCARAARRGTAPDHDRARGAAAPARRPRGRAARAGGAAGGRRRGGRGRSLRGAAAGGRAQARSPGADVVDPAARRTSFSRGARPGLPHGRERLPGGHHRRPLRPAADR